MECINNSKDLLKIIDVTYKCTVGSFVNDKIIFNLGLKENIKYTNALFNLVDKKHIRNVVLPLDLKNLPEKISEKSYVYIYESTDTLKLSKFEKLWQLEKPKRPSNYFKCVWKGKLEELNSFNKNGKKNRIYHIIIGIDSDNCIENTKNKKIVSCQLDLGCERYTVRRNPLPIKYFLEFMNKNNEFIKENIYRTDKY